MAGDPARLDIDELCDRFAVMLQARTSDLVGRAFPGSDEADAVDADEFPALARLLELVCRQALEATAETAARFFRDRARIVAGLLGGVDPGPLVAVEPADADRHQGGRSVAFLHFGRNGGRIVYKPRSVESSALYDRLLTWINARVPALDLAGVPTLVEPGYGWSRLVAPAPCRTVDDARRFYRRQGALLAVLHAANATDMHAENIIARRDQPLLIDTETLLHPMPSTALLADADPALTVLQRSVLRTLLLPTLIHDGDTAMDVSGLSGAVGVGAAGARGPNRPVLDGVVLDPADHLADLLRGFGEAYTAICRDAESFCRELAEASEIRTRFVARSTRTYAALLEEALEPGRLRDPGRRREWLFSTLTEKAASEDVARLSEHECTDLQGADIPVFFARPGSRAVWSSRGRRIEDVVEVSGLDAATAKVRAMDGADRRRQERMIAAAFAIRDSKVRHWCSAADTPADGGHRPAGTFDPQWALDQAIGVAHGLEDLAHRGHGRVNWLGLEPLEDGHWKVMPTGVGLSHGYPGVALFLAQLGSVTGRSEFLDLAESSLTTVPALLAALSSRPGHLAAIGCGFSGLGGVAYALARLGVLLDSRPLRRAAVTAVELLTRAVGDDDTFADGRAGALVALRAVRRDLGTPKLGTTTSRELARALGDARPHGPGFLHGDDGIGWALRGEDSGIEDPGTQRPGITISQGPDTSAPRPAPPDDSWCAGLAGSAVGGGLAPGDLAGWLDRLARTRPVAVLAPCHGELGVLEALILLSPGSPPARAALDHRRARLPQAVADGASFSATPRAVPTPGFLHGLAGVGYGLLRAAFPETVPSVLTMQPGR